MPRMYPCSHSYVRIASHNVTAWNEALGDMVRIRREKIGMTVQGLVEALEDHDVFLSKDTIYSIQSGRRGPNPAARLAIERILGMREGYLLVREPRKRRQSRGTEVT